MHPWKYYDEYYVQIQLMAKYYVIKFVSDLRQVCGFLRVLQFPSPIKIDHNDTTEIFN